MNTPRFDPTVSIGNVFTMIAGVIAVMVILVSDQTANAKRDERVNYIEKQVKENTDIQSDIIVMREDVVRIQVNQKNHEKMLSRILDHLEE